LNIYKLGEFAHNETKYLSPKIMKKHLVFEGF
jgi:hypothetical protein